MSSCPSIRRGMPQAGALMKKSLVCSHVRWPTAWREARKLSEHITYQIVWAFAILDYQRHDLGTATCTLLTVRLYSSEQLKENWRHFFWPAHYEQCNFPREMQNQARALPEQHENLWFNKDGPYKLELMCEPLELKTSKFPYSPHIFSFKLPPDLPSKIIKT